MAKKQSASDRDNMIEQYLSQWREARARLDAILGSSGENDRLLQSGPYCRSIPLDDSALAVARRKVEALKCKMVVADASQAADYLLFERDLEAGNPDAVAADLEALIDRIDGTTCAPDPASVARANNQIAIWIRDAMAAHDRYAAKRTAEGLPPRAPFPVGGAFERPVDAIRARVDGRYDDLSTPDFAAQIRKAEGEVRTILLNQATAKQREEQEAERRREALQAAAAKPTTQGNTSNPAELRREQAARETEEDALISKYLGVTHHYTQFGVLH